MSVTSRSDNFFQTTTSLDELNRKARKSYNTSGNPIKLPSKILSVTPDPQDDQAIYAAESAGTVKRVELENGTITHTYRGPEAPLTCVCIARTPAGDTVFAGCWDKHIWGWPVSASSASATLPSIRIAGHSDFVKCLLPVSTAATSLLLSGSADGTLIIWSLTTATPTKLHSLRPESSSRGIQCLALDPLSDLDSLTIFLGTSDRPIYSFTLPLSPPPTPHTLKTLPLSPPLLVHETSIYDLFFTPSGDLWTASADKTAKRLVRADATFTADTILPHPDFVRGIAVSETAGLAITACRDEDVRVWSTATGALLHTFAGHFEEVTSLCLLDRRQCVVSAGIDATVRHWSIAPHDLRDAMEHRHTPTPTPTPAVLLTEEEDRELRELMEAEEGEVQEHIADELQ